MALRVSLRRRLGTPPQAPGVVPPDPIATLDGPFDPELVQLRGALLPYRRRLWVRRLVRRGWIALAAVVIAELVLWTLARVVPLERAPMLGAAIPLVGILGWLIAGVRARPRVGETALALDAEGALGDRVSSALELAVAFPDSAGPSEDAEDDAEAHGPLDEAAETDRFVRRQRRDAVRAIGMAPVRLFRPRFSRQPATVALVGALLLVPMTLLPNPQDAVIAQQQQVREAADRQAEKIDRVADELADKGQGPDDPRTRLAQELRDLARQLRERPDDLDANLARLGAIETDVRSQVDPANEQRAASLTALSRALSSAATAKPDENRDGDPEKARDDLKELGDELDQMTPEQQRELARQLAGLEATASQADGAAGTALSDAAQSLAQGDTAGARSALDRLGEALAGADRRVTATRDLAGAASRLQDARRDLADAGRRTAGQGQGQPGQGQQGQGQAQGSPGTGQGQGQGQGSPNPSGASQGQGQGQGQGKARVKAKGRVKAKARARGKGRGKGKAKVRAPSAAAARTRAHSATGQAAMASRPGRPTRTDPRSSARTCRRSSRHSIASAGRGTRRTWRGPVATVRPSKATSRARAPTTGR